VTGSPQGEAERTVLDLLTLGELPIVSTTQRRTYVEPVTDRDIAYLQYTSGSTSDPRGVIVTHDNLMANLSVAWKLLEYTHDAVNVSWCPLTHDMGLILGALPSAVFGFTSIVMPPTAFIRRPMAWLRAVDRYRGTHGYSPNFGYDLLVDRSTPQERQALDLSCAHIFVNGAEPVRRRTCDRFRETFADSNWNPTALSPGYGLAESAVLVSASPPGQDDVLVWVDAAALEQDRIELRDEHDQGVRELVGDGIPGHGYDIRIVDPITLEQLPPDQVGELWIRGASVSPGYWRRPQETAEAFGSSMVGDDRGPYLRTGDLAFMHADEIIICGRAKDLIVVRGRNLYPQDIELTAEQAHPAVRLGGSAAFSIEDDAGTALVVVAEIDGEPDEAAVADAVRGAVLNEFEVRVADVLLVGPQTVPKTSSGKKQRKATRKLWLAARESGATPLRSAPKS
jgi:acyl-CoA synthetase (AMP-forming)/AMP-acid ligase II